MRSAVAFLFVALAFAGCTTPAEPVSPLFGVCPQWIDGAPMQASMSAPGEQSFEPAHQMESAGTERPLDMYQLVISGITTDGTIELRATTSDGRVLRFTDVRDPDAPRTPTFLAVNANSGTVAVDIYLTDVTQGADAAPANLVLSATGQNGAKGAFDVDVTPGYRVCGAPL